MVSPSKIFNTSNSGFKVSFDCSKKDGLKTHRGSKQKLSSVKHPQFMCNIKFYLDIRNRIQLAKVESTLKSYGAKIEIFFSRDVNVVVSDKAEWMGNAQSPTTSVSPLTIPSPSSNQDQRFAVPKSRASAMLEKVSRQPASPYCSPVELAQKWMIPVFSVPNLWRYISKIKEAKLSKLNEKEKQRQQKELVENKIVIYPGDSPFIKIESLVSPSKPEFLQLGAWPRLNLDGHLGQCPFRSPSPPSSDEHSKKQESKLFQVKDKVAVELIQYDTDFRIKKNLKIGECEEEDEEEEEKEEKAENINDLNNPNGSNVCLSRVCFTKMTRRPAKSNVVSNEDETTNIADSRQNLSLCNGHTGRNITRQSSHELLKVQCNGLTTSHRNSKLLSPSGSDVLPLPTSRRSTRRASASWCGSTRELSQLSPTDSEIENIRRSDSSFETHDPALDSSGITLRPKGQLWLPIALIGTTAEENGNCIRKRYEYSIRQSDNLKFLPDLDRVDEKSKYDIDDSQIMSRVSRESDCSMNSNWSSQNDCHIKRNADKKDAYCIITRNTKIKNEEVNGRSRESSVDSLKCSEQKSCTVGKKRSLSVCGRTSPSLKRTRTMSTNSVHSVVRRKKMSPEEKLLQDNKEYFKMEVLNTKLRSSGSLLNVSPNKDSGTSEEVAKPVEKIDKIIIKKIRLRGRKKKNRWTKANGKKGNEIKYATIVIENKKNNNVKINGVIRKKRQSELMKLCNEAESFMFGESSRQGSTAAESETEESRKKKNGNNSPSKSNVFEEAGAEGPTKSGEKKVRRKRRSHAEAFIHDNLDYYKFETPGSRLRYQGSFLDVKSEDKDFIYTLKQKKKERLSTEQNKKNELLERLQINVDVKEEANDNQEKKKSSVNPSEEIEKILFSFETIPASEPWYEVYKRQDEGMENYHPLLSDPDDQPFLLPYELPKPTYSKSTLVNDYYKKRRKKLVHLFNHPRKSPRCHASTLAILSSLKKRKRRSGTNISVNAMLTESPPSVSEKLKGEEEAKKSENESEEVLDFLYDDERLEEGEEIMLEPLCDSEGKPKQKNSDLGKGVDEEVKTWKIGGRGKKSVKVESANEPEVEEKHFSVQSLESDSFLKDMVIDLGKKSGLPVNITTILENFRNCRSMEVPDVNLITETNGNSFLDGLEKNFRKRKKTRKINKTGWDNRKTRRRTTGSKVVEVKDVESDEVTVKPNAVKYKTRVRENGICSENIISDSKRRTCGKIEDKPKLRPRSGLSGRRFSQDSESLPESFDSASRDVPPCIVRVKKMSETCLRLRCASAKYNIQKKRLALSRRKKRVIDYAWTTRKR